MLKNNRLKIVDLFSGIGGWSTGLKKAGHEIIWAVDNWEKALENYKLNHPETQISIMDVREISPDDKRIKEADLIVGSPPCKRFSVLNKFRDDDLELTHEFFRIVGDKPFIMENISRVGTVIEKKGMDFPGRGYKIKMSDFGVPQIRKRYIRTNILDIDKIVSVQKDLSYYLPLFNKINYADKLIRDEPLHRPRIIELMSKISGGQHTGYGVYYRIPKSGYSSTIVNITKAMMVHPEKNRRLNIYEAAILQTFPLNYKFKGTVSEIAEQIGNAVPPAFSEIIGKELIKWAKNGKPIIWK